MQKSTEQALLWRTLIALAICAVAVVICYYWIDRSVAFFVARNKLNTISLFRWLTYPPPTLQWWSPLILAVIMVRRAWGPWKSCEQGLLIATVSLIIADQCRVSLGDVFGRYWPETWFNNNPSLLGTGTYGFHPFRHGDDIGSFPSGHACRIAAFSGVWWMAIPRSRALIVTVCPPMFISLVLMNYHFVGDVIAGCTLGGIVAAYSLHLAGNCSSGTADLGQTSTG